AGTVESCTRENFTGRTTKVDEVSALGKLCQQREWLPSMDVSRRRPSELCLEELPSWLDNAHPEAARVAEALRMRKNEVALAATMLGVPTQVLQQLQRDKDRYNQPFPDETIADPDRRRVQVQSSSRSLSARTY